MAAATPTTHDAIIKHLYPDPNDVLISMYENNTLFAMLKKNFAGYGKNWHRPVRIAHTAGRSHLYSSAKKNKAASVVKEFQINVTDNYSLYSVGGRLQAQTSNSKGAFVDAFEFELDSAMDAMKRNMGYEPYFNGGGKIGVVGSVSTNVITLSNVNDIVKFEVGQPIVSSLTDGTSGAVKPGVAYIASIDRDLGTISLPVGQNWTDAGNLPTVAAADFLFTDGDFGLGIKGLDAWIPATAPTTGDSFFLLDRSADPTRLAGSRVDVRTLGPEEQIQKMAQVSNRNGGKLSHVFYNDIDYLALILALGSRRQIANTEVEGQIGFEGVKISTGYGTIGAYADFNCQQGLGWGLELKNWQLSGPGEFPKIEARDGNRLVREDTADAFEGKIYGYYQMESKKVVGSVRGRLTA